MVVIELNTSSGFKNFQLAKGRSEVAVEGDGATQVVYGVARLACLPGAEHVARIEVLAVLPLHLFLVIPSGRNCESLSWAY